MNIFILTKDCLTMIMLTMLITMTRTMRRMMKRLMAMTMKIKIIQPARVGPKGLRAESARAVTGRRCPHSGVG